LEFQAPASCLTTDLDAAAFGEEMVYRGYLMNRVADLFAKSRTGWIISLLGVNVLFGFAHQ
jgi:membrane protease YdiL (CAAX protease family)